MGQCFSKHREEEPLFASVKPIGSCEQTDDAVDGNADGPINSTDELHALDLSIFLRQERDMHASDNDEDIRKKEKMKKFEHILSNIIDDFIFVSGEVCAQDKELLEKYHITDIINCAGKTTKNAFPDLFQYFTLCLDDSMTEDISHAFIPLMNMLYNMNKDENKSNKTTISRWCKVSKPTFLGDITKRPSKVLIHCTHGVSRSCSLVIAYYMYINRCSCDDAVTAVRKKRGICKPNANFLIQLQQWERVLNWNSNSTKPVAFHITASGSRLIESSDIEMTMDTDSFIVLFNGYIHYYLPEHANDEVQDVFQEASLFLQQLHHFTLAQSVMKTDDTNTIGTNKMSFNRFLTKCGIRMQDNNFNSYPRPRLQIARSACTNEDKESVRYTRENRGRSEPIRVTSRRHIKIEEPEARLDWGDENENKFNGSQKLWEYSPDCAYDIEGLTNYDWDDLWEDRVFLLWVRNNDNIDENMLYVWIGSNYAELDTTNESACEIFAEEIGHEFLNNEMIISCSTDEERNASGVQVEFEGKETEGFEHAMELSWDVSDE